MLNNVANSETPMRIGFILPLPTKYSFVVSCFRLKYQPRAIVLLAYTIRISQSRPPIPAVRPLAPGSAAMQSVEPTSRNTERIGDQRRGELMSRASLHSNCSAQGYCMVNPQRKKTSVESWSRGVVPDWLLLQYSIAPVLHCSNTYRGRQLACASHTTTGS